MICTSVNWGRSSPAWLALCLVSLALPRPLSAADWHSDLASAQAEARERGLPLLIHVYSRNCGPCRTMEHEVFSSPAFEQTTGDQFVLLKLDTARQRAVAESLGVTSLPSDLVMSPEGRVIFRREGFQPGGGRAYLDSLARHRGTPRPPTDPANSANANPGSLLTGSPERGTLNRSTASRPASPPGDGRPERPARPLTQSGITPAGPSPAAVSEFPPRTPRSPTTTPRTANHGTGSAAPSAEGWMPPRTTGAMGVSARTVPSDTEPPTAGLTDTQWGLEGYCPVTLKLAGRWQAGSEEWTARFEGRQYKFADGAAREAFQLDPAAHAPQAGGADLVVFESTGRSVSGSTQFAAYFNGQLYLFSSRESRTAFQRNPARYARGREGALRSQFERLAGQTGAPAL